MKVADLKQRTIAGIAWSTGAHAGTQVIQFAIGVLLARLLSPEEFGLIGMVLVFSGFAGLFAEFGFHFEFCFEFSPQFSLSFVHDFRP